MSSGLGDASMPESSLSRIVRLPRYDSKGQTKARRHLRPPHAQLPEQKLTRPDTNKNFINVTTGRQIHLIQHGSVARLPGFLGLQLHLSESNPVHDVTGVSHQVLNRLGLVGRRLLLIEDDPAQAHLYFIRLTRAGATVVVVSDRQLSTLSHRDLTAFDGIVVDLEMPLRRGTEIVAWLRVSGYPGALVGFSSRLTEELIDLWLAAGCDEVRLKASEELVSVIIAAVDSRASMTSRASA